MLTFNNLAVVPSVTLGQATFVPGPGVVRLGGWPARQLAWRRRLGAVVLSSASLNEGVLSVFLADGSSYRCLESAFEGGFPEAFLEAIRDAVSSSTPVFLCVAVGASGRAAPGFFCGLSTSLPSAAPVAPAAGTVSGF